MCVIMNVNQLRSASDGEADSSGDDRPAVPAAAKTSMAAKAAPPKALTPKAAAQAAITKAAEVECPRTAAQDTTREAAASKVAVEGKQRRQHATPQAPAPKVAVKGKQGRQHATPQAPAPKVAVKGKQGRQHETPAPKAQAKTSNKPAYRSFSHELSRSQVLCRTGGTGPGSCIRLKYGVGQKFANVAAARKAAEKWVITPQ
jgi:hypothetical protein